MARRPIAQERGGWKWKNGKLRLYSFGESDGEKTEIVFNLFSVRIYSLADWLESDKMTKEVVIIAVAVHIIRLIFYGLSSNFLTFPFDTSFVDVQEICPGFTKP